MKVSKEVKVGLFMTTAIALLYLGFNYLKGIDFFDSTKKYFAVYENVDGLAMSNPVLVNGYAVGRVSDISILREKQNKVLVEFDIDSDVILGDSTVAILNSNFLGGKSILLNIGKVDKPLQPRDTIIAGVAKGLTDIIAESAVPVADNLQTTLRKLNTILDGLNRNTARLDTMFVKLQRTPGLLNQTLITANGNIEGLSTEFKTVASNLNGTLTDLKPTLSNFKVLSDSLKRIQINGTLTKANSALTKLNETLTKFNKGDNTVSKLMNDDELYNNLNKLLRSLDTLATHMNSNPNHFFAPLGKSKKKVDRDLKKQAEKSKTK